MSTSIDPNEKVEIYEELNLTKCEGVVFKEVDAPYSPGRPNSGGTQLKYKFVESASFIVTARNEKHSVRLGLYDGDKLVPAGNVTIPLNHPMPAPDDVCEIQFLYAFKESGLNQKPVLVLPRRGFVPTLRVHRAHRGRSPQPLPTERNSLPPVMNQPIPRSGTEPLKIGDHVQIGPEWQDPGDEKYERFVIEAPDDCTRVSIQEVVPGLFFQPVEWIEADNLIHLPPEFTNLQLSKPGRRSPPATPRMTPPRQPAAIAGVKRSGLIDSAALVLKRRIAADLIEFFGEDVIRRLQDGGRPGWECDLRTVRDRHVSLVANGADPSRKQQCA